MLCCRTCKLGCAPGGLLTVPTPPLPSVHPLNPAGLKVAVVERGPLLGRAQEWNISRKELAELVSGAWRPRDWERVCG